MRNNTANKDEHVYKWEAGYEKTWQSLQEDASGSLRQAVADYVATSRRQQLADSKPKGRFNAGLMRHLYLVLDMSSAMQIADLKPTRLHSCVELLQEFSSEFFAECPVGQLGLIVSREKKAEKLEELGGSAKLINDRLKSLTDRNCLGEPSLINCLTLALQTLKYMPQHSSREILFVWGSLTTCDVGEIDEFYGLLRKHKIAVSVISLSAEVFVLRQLVSETGGRYAVILDESHLREKLRENLHPANAAVGSVEPTLVKMGFPSLVRSEFASPCLCHSHKAGTAGSVKEIGLSTEGYLCPQCGGKYCELPCECIVCNLSLVSGPLLARSYHHLFPVKPFVEWTEPDGIESARCCGCNWPLGRHQSQQPAAPRQCPDCARLFCPDCDLVCHDLLNVCPGCTS